MARRNTRLLAEEKDRAERAFAEAQQASLAKTEFLSRMSHEIRTPMNGIMGMTAIALESIGDDGKVRTCLEKVTLSSEHLLSLINDILDMSKIESGKVEIKNEPFDLSTFIGSLAAVFRTQASRAQTSPSTPWWRARCPAHAGGRSRCGSTRWSTTSWATRSSSLLEGGSVTLRIERLARDAAGRDAIWLRFAVDDTGCGIEPEHLDKIFASFEQGDASVARKHGGTGLGLAITKRFAELMGGRIPRGQRRGATGRRSRWTCRSGAPRRGSLPSCDDAGGRGGRRTPVARHPDVARLRGQRASSCAEDNALNQRDSRGGAWPWRCASVVAASTGARGGGARSRRSDAGHSSTSMLMDVQMPELDGYECGARHPGAWTAPDARPPWPFVAMTANAFAEDEERSADERDGRPS